MPRPVGKVAPAAGTGIGHALWRRDKASGQVLSANGEILKNYSMRGGG